MNLSTVAQIQAALQFDSYDLECCKRAQIYKNTCLLISTRAFIEYSEQISKGRMWTRLPKVGKSEKTNSDFWGSNPELGFTGDRWTGFHLITYRCLGRKAETCAGCSISRFLVLEMEKNHL